MGTDILSIFSGPTQPLGCCSNCFHRLPRSPNQTGGVIQHVRVMNPDTGSLVTLNLLDAIRYMFKDKSSSAPPCSDSAELTFCVTCGPLFKLLLKTFNSFTERSAEDSGVYKFLVDRSVLPLEVKLEAEDEEDMDQDQGFLVPIIEMSTSQSRRSSRPRRPRKPKFESENESEPDPDLEPKSEPESEDDQGWPDQDTQDNENDSDFETIVPEVKNQKRKRGRPRKHFKEVQQRAKRAYQKRKDGEKRIRKKYTSKPKPKLAGTEPRKPRHPIMSMAEAEAEFYKADADTPVLVKCSLCPEEMDSLKSWVEHQATVHAKDVGWRVDAVVVPPEFTENKTKQGRRIPCPECWKPYRTFLIRDHIEGVHRGNLPVQCPDCDKRFVNEALLKVHSRTHTQRSTEKSHLCLLCGAGFLEKNSLKRHELCHTLELKKRHKCEDCAASFETPTRLAAHRWTHIPIAERVKPFLCSECGMSFESKRRLNGHLYNHKKSAKRESKCGLCDKEYTRNSGLKEHMMIVHKLSEPAAKAAIGMRNNAVPIILPGEEIRPPPSKPQKPGPTCSVCSKKYSRREYLTSHLISAHGKTEEEAKSMTGLETKRLLPSLPSSSPVKRVRKSVVRRPQIQIEIGSESSRHDSEAGPLPQTDESESQVVEVLQQDVLHLGFPNANPYQPFPPHQLHPQWSTEHYQHYAFSRN